MSDRVEVEGLALGMTTEEAIATCAARGWEHTIKPADERYTIAPGRPVLMLTAKFEGGRIVVLEATYDPKDPRRAAAPLHQLPVARKGALFGREWRAAWAEDRRAVIVAEGDGSRVIAVQLGVIASEREVGAYLATYGQGLAAPERG